MARRRNGGTLPYTLSTVEALLRLRNKYQFTLFTTQDNHEYDALNLPVIRLPNAFQLAGMWLAGREPFEDVEKVLAPIYSVVLLTTTRPFAFTLHDLQERHFPANFGLATRLWRKFVNQSLARRACQIVCESDFVAHDIKIFLGVPKTKISVIPAPPIQSFSGIQINENGASELRRKYGLPARYLFYPAQFWPHKNHLRLIDALAIVLTNEPDCCLVLTGSKRGTYEKVFQRVAQLGLSRNVRHVGYVTQSELQLLYCHATVVVIPTLFESISIPVYEALSLGCPVCVSNVVGLPEQIGDAGLLFDPYSVDDIAAKIRTVLSDAELRPELAERGYRRMLSVTQSDYALCLAKLIEAL
jgi:glycosyltransferase involved in cell wall biosynthesis